jgi:hypothetical protein
MEYEVYRLDKRYRLSHTGEAIIATNNLAVACSYCFEHYVKYKEPICVFQPRHQVYREHYAPWLQVDPEETFPQRILGIIRRVFGSKWIKPYN